MVKVATDSELRSGVPESMVRKKDPNLLLADYIHKKIVAVTRGARGDGVRDQGESIAIIPILSRYYSIDRIASRVPALQDDCCGRIVLISVPCVSQDARFP